MATKIALSGNPNSGKTTTFNALTGSSQYVGNWPGVTVEKKEGSLKFNKNITIVDLPGIYSLSPYTLEEVVARDYLINDPPDVILNIVDATNIERNLYLTTQLMEMGVPVVIALNMFDIVDKNGDKIDLEKIQSALGVKVFGVSALKEKGLKEATEEATKVSKEKAFTPKIFSKPISESLTEIERLISSVVTNEKQRYWYAVKLFERDEKAVATLPLTEEISSKIEKITSELETKLDDTSESLITFERYEYISKIIKDSVVKKHNNNMSPSDKIDQVVTNKYFALPIFILIMWFVYFISVSSIGTIITDWTNDVFFAEIVTGKATAFLEAIKVSPWVMSLVIDGIIGGVGAVLGFVPQIMILFFLLSILEDCGYMARVAFIMDRIFRKFGLSGKSFIPVLISSGCGVPGVMASRTIENIKDRKMTIIITTFIPCSAKLPIIALIAGSIFKGSSLIAPSMYFLGIAAIIFSGIVLKKSKLFNGDPAPFVMELPQYHFPSIKGVLIHTLDRVKSFIAKAGTIIFVASTAIWFLSNFNFQLQMVESPDSILAFLGKIIAPIFAPIGFGTWQSAVATISALLAKENLVASLGILYNLGTDVTTDTQKLLNAFSANFNAVSAISFMVFNMLCVPCVAAVGAIHREMGTWKWTLIAISYQTILAYAVSFIINNIGKVIFLSAPIGIGTFLAVIVIGIMVWLLIRDVSPKIKTNISFTRGA